MSATTSPHHRPDNNKRPRDEHQEPSSRETSRSTRPRGSAQLYLGGIGRLKEDALSEFFRNNYGPVSEIRLHADKGYGFFRFQDPRHAEQFLASQVSLRLNGQDFIVRAARNVGEAPKQSGGDHQHTQSSAPLPSRHIPQVAPDTTAAKLSGCRLYIVCARSVDETTLAEQFEGLGPLLECQIVRDAQGASQGSAFVTFASPSSALRALEMSGYEVNGREMKIVPADVAMAHPMSAGEGDEAAAEGSSDYEIYEIPESPEEIRARQEKVQAAVAQGLAAAKAGQNAIDELLYAASAGRKYKEEEYDY
eukprot:gnl/Spiro4/23938_TR11853_c0_g1_i1.p1 gnl/Spiro4/23938_TR11853_c0_g1~~gnl/Spiro4/23938_TR11853_c0_g1_i1.p1  ORF type:complete len:318 (+),score=48.69 gnl/Spiro4/23938_TR11853_c0_g1_i1:36-956(+)